MRLNSQLSYSYNFFQLSRAYTWLFPSTAVAISTLSLLPSQVRAQSLVDPSTITPDSSTGISLSAIGESTAAAIESSTGWQTGGWHTFPPAPVDPLPARPLFNLASGKQSPKPTEPLVSGTSVRNQAIAAGSDGERLLQQPDTDASPLPTSSVLEAADSGEPIEAETSLVRDLVAPMPISSQHMPQAVADTNGNASPESVSSRETDSIAFGDLEAQPRINLVTQPPFSSDPLEEDPELALDEPDFDLESHSLIGQVHLEMPEHSPFAGFVKSDLETDDSTQPQPISAGSFGAGQTQPVPQSFSSPTFSRASLSSSVVSDIEPTEELSEADASTTVASQSQLSERAEIAVYLPEADRLQPEPTFEVPLWSYRLESSVSRFDCFADIEETAVDEIPVEEGFDPAIRISANEDATGQGEELPAAHLDYATASDSLGAKASRLQMRSLQQYLPSPAFTISPILERQTSPSDTTAADVTNEQAEPLTTLSAAAFASAISKPSFRQIPVRSDALKGTLRAKTDLLAQVSVKTTATDYYKAAIARYPQNEGLKIALAQIYLNRQQIQQATEILQPLSAQGNLKAQILLKEFILINRPEPPRRSESTGKAETTSRPATTEIQLDFENENSSSTVNQFIGSTVRFRLDDGEQSQNETVQILRLGYNNFSQVGIEEITNIPIQVGVEKTLGNLVLSAGGGIDVFNRLAAVPNIFAKATWDIDPNLSLYGDIEYGAYKFNADTLENEVKALRVTPSVYWQIDDNTSFFSSFTWGSYSDGNREQELFSSVERTFGDFFVGASLFYWHYSKDLDNGYFDPDSFLFYEGEVGWDGNISEELGCRVSAGLGEKNFEGSTSLSSTYQARCEIELGKRFEASLGYEYSIGIEAGRFTGPGKSEIIGQVRFTF